MFDTDDLRKQIIDYVFNKNKKRKPKIKPPADSLTVQERKPLLAEASFRPFPFSKPPVVESESINVQPESLIKMFLPKPTTLPKLPEPSTSGIAGKSTAALDVPLDLTEVPKRPRWLKVDKRTNMPKVFNRIFGWLKITRWQRDIADGLVKCCTGKKVDRRKFKREFRRRVAAEKRARWRLKIATEYPHPTDIPDDIFYNPNYGGGEVIHQVPLGIENQHR